MMTLMEGYKTRYSAAQDEELSLEQYLDLCKRDPAAYASAAAANAAASAAHSYAAASASPEAKAAAAAAAKSAAAANAAADSSPALFLRTSLSG